MNTLRIAAIAIRELFYERVFYLLIGFTLFCAVLSLFLGQLTYAEQAKLSIDLLLGGMHLTLILFAVFMGISLFQREIAMGSVAMLLSKPIARSHFLIGKYLGQLMVELGVLLMMGLIVVLMAKSFKYGSTLAIFQTTLLISFEIAVLTAIAYCFAVNTGPINSSIGTLSFFILGHLRESVNQHVLTSKETRLIWTIARNAIPNLEMFNTKNLASYGSFISLAELSWVALYAAVCCAFFLFLACLTFETKDIFT